MASYKLLFKRSAQKELMNIPPKDVKKIVKNIENLGKNPRPVGCEKLSQHDYYRIRQGNYRVIYAINDHIKEVLIYKIGHRREIYRDF